MIGDTIAIFCKILFETGPWTPKKDGVKCFKFVCMCLCIRVILKTCLSNEKKRKLSLVIKQKATPPLTSAERRPTDALDCCLFHL